MEAVIALAILGTVIYFVYKTIHSIIRIQKGAPVAQLWQEDKGFQFVATIIAGALTILAVWMLMKGGQDSTAQVKESKIKVASVPAQSPSTRAAAVPASKAEWTAIQKFIRDIWSLGLRIDEAQKRREQATHTSVQQFDLDGVRRAQVVYLKKIDDVLKALERINVPSIADSDAHMFALKAHNSLNDKLLIERTQTNGVINGIENPDGMASEDVLKRLTDDSNLKSASMVMALHRIFWSYGYKDEDFDEKTFVLKRDAKPTTTTSFNRGEL